MIDPRIYQAVALCVYYFYSVCFGGWWFAMSDGRLEPEERRGLEDKYLHMCQIAEDSARELMEEIKCYQELSEERKTC